MPVAINLFRARALLQNVFECEGSHIGENHYLPG